MTDGRNDMTRFIGGSPVMVLVRLVLLSVVVGVILAALGLDPRNILRSLTDLIDYIGRFGFDALTHVWRYFLLGAVIVFPLWLILRLFRGLR